MMLFAAIPIMWGQPRNQAEEIRVILSSSQTTHIHDVAPEATFAFVANTLQVTLDATHYASYSVTLTAPAGDSVTVNATTPTVTIPVTAGDAYVVTVDGGDYGTYDGVFSRTGAATVTLSDRQALRLAQNRRTGNSGVNFYSATVPAVINDSLRCPVPTPPAQAWATDTGVEKWLLFVDERPDWGWAHECTYIYMPKEVSASDSVTMLTYPGQLPPRGVAFSPVELGVTFGLSDFHVLPQSVVSGFTPAVMGPGAGLHDTKVVVIGSFCDQGSGIIPPGQRNWNACAAFYQILTAKFGIPSADIHLLIGNESGMTRDEDYNWAPMPKDLDGDGIDEPIAGATHNNIRAVFAQLAAEHDRHPLRHLFVFYSGDAAMAEDYEHNIVSMAAADGMITGTELNEWIGSVNVGTVSGTFLCNYSYWFPDALPHENIVLTTSTGVVGGVQSEYPHCYHPGYSSYSYYWLSALAGADLATGQVIATDLNSDGIESFSELCEASDTIYRWHTRAICNMDPRPCPTPPGYPGIHSTPAALQDSVSFTRLPRCAALATRRCPGDSTDMKWDSPDIWVRNQDDGLAHTESEPVRLTGGQPVYVYVRVHNLGDTVAAPGKRSLRLYVSPSGERLDRHMMCLPFPSHLIACTPTGAIACGDSATYVYEWAWDEAPGEPDDPLEYGASADYDWEALYERSGYTLPVRLTALLATGEDEGLLNDGELSYPDVAGHKFTFQQKVAIRPKDGKSKVVYNVPFAPEVYKYCQFDIPLAVRQPGRHSISIVPDQAHSTGTVLSNTFRTFFDLSSDLQSAIDSTSTLTAVTAVGGTQGRYRLQNANASFNNLNLVKSGSYTVTLTCDINAYATLLNGADWRYHVVLRDSAGAIVGGQAVRVLEEAGHPGGGIMSGTVPGISTSPENGGRCLLTETNVTEPARYEWYSAEMNKVDEGKAVSVSRDDTGDWCVLKVTFAGSGREEYAVAPLSALPGIERVSPVPFDGTMTVRLTGPAEAGMGVRIVSVARASTPMEAALPPGAVELDLSTAALPAGQYVVCLTHNGGVVQSVNAIKQTK